MTRLALALWLFVFESQCITFDRVYLDFFNDLSSRNWKYGHFFSKNPGNAHWEILPFISHHSSCCQTRAGELRNVIIYNYHNMRTGFVNVSIAFFKLFRYSVCADGAHDAGTSDCGGRRSGMTFNSNRLRIWLLLLLFEKNSVRITYVLLLIYRGTDLEMTHGAKREQDCTKSKI